MAPVADPPIQGRSGAMGEGQCGLAPSWLPWPSAERKRGRDCRSPRAGLRVEGRIQHSRNPHLRRVVFLVAGSEVGPFVFHCSLHPYGHADLGFDALDAFSAVVEGTVERADFTEEGSAIYLRDCHLVSYSLLPPPPSPDAGGERIAG